MRIRATLLVLACVFVTAQAQEPAGLTPLLRAAAFGSVEELQKLATPAADLTAATPGGLTALHLAAGDSRKIRLLLDRGADVHARSTVGRTPLLAAAAANGTVETVRLLLAKGADANAADNTGVTPILAAASVDDGAVVKLLLEHGANVAVRANVPQSSTPLMAAAYNGNVELVRLFLSRDREVNVFSGDSGAKVKQGVVQFSRVTALHMAAVGGRPEAVDLILRAGADVNARDIRGMTPLMWAVATDRPQPAIVRLLIEHGADPLVRSSVGESAVDWARKFNHPAILAVMKLPPAPSGVEAQDLTAAVPAAAESVLPTPRAAVERAVPVLSRASASVLTDGGCVACHAQPVTVMAADIAAARKWTVQPAATHLAVSHGSLTPMTEGLLQGREAGGNPDTQLYIGMMAAGVKAPASPGLEAVAYYLAAKQRTAGNWHGIGATRAPMQDGDVSRTAMAIRTLAAYAPAGRREEFTDRIARAATWLSVQTPLSTEDRVMQLLGLHWAGVSDQVVAARQRELMALQRADGGWGQTPFLASDAYATGQAIYVLRELGIAATDPALQRGTAFLLRTQADDGTWFVKSRAMKIQPYFESGFPYGHDQWISQTGTAWAVMALSAAAGDEPPLRSSNAR
jgi:ankyrin repeat protein